jgi:hypothetical protein
MARSRSQRLSIYPNPESLPLPTMFRTTQVPLTALIYSLLQPNTKPRAMPRGPLFTHQLLLTSWERMKGFGTVPFPSILHLWIAT